MDIKILFEDAENTPSSILLKKSVFGKNIYFAGGSSNMEKMLSKIKEDGDEIIIFYDVSPNNMNTILRYYALSDVADSMEGNSNISVIPIVCMEHIVCRMLKDYGYDSIMEGKIGVLADNLIGQFRYGAALEVIKGNIKLETSLERVYKFILNNQSMKCKRNTFRYEKDGDRREGSIYGKFYESDCTCEEHYCKIKCTDTASVKANRLYAELPLCVITEEKDKQRMAECGISIVRTDINEVKRRTQTAYNIMCDEMGIDRIIIQ